MGEPKFRFLTCLELLKAHLRARAEGDRLSLPQRFGFCYYQYALLTNLSQTSDLILMILDATKRAEQRALLETELEVVGIRLNREPP